MRSVIVTSLLLAVCVVAQEYPKQNGFVNDFANQLPLSAVQALEKKVRDYQRATGNQIGVAVVPSLNGVPVEEYSLGLFRAWGVGIYGLNNGVLFVWAPSERKIRIEVGRGLEGPLNEGERSRILARVRELFRASKYEEGVNAAVDGIITVLSPGEAAPSAPPPEPTESSSSFWIALGVAVALGLGLWWLVRRSRAARWREQLPRQLAEADGALAEVERWRADAQVALSELRREAPADVWGRFEQMLGVAPGELAQLKSNLDRLRQLPEGGYSELKTVDHGLRHWNDRLHAILAGIQEVRSTLDALRQRRVEAQRMLDEIPSKLVRMEAQGAGPAQGLMDAASETYGRALAESRQPMPNWLLVYDLLADVDACVERIENPSLTRYQPIRTWDGDFDSPALLAMNAMYAAQMESSSGSSVSFDSGSSSSFDSSGGFGGGDSGGSGSSSDY
jgi:uncharacterized protein